MYIREYIMLCAGRLCAEDAGGGAKPGCLPERSTGGYEIIKPNHNLKRTGDHYIHLVRSIIFRRPFIYYFIGW